MRFPVLVVVTSLLTGCAARPGPLVPEHFADVTAYRQARARLVADERAWHAGVNRLALDFAWRRVPPPPSTTCGWRFRTPDGDRDDLSWTTPSTVNGVYRDGSSIASSPRRPAS